MVEHGGGQPAVEPALPASMFGQRPKQSFDRDRAVAALHDFDLGMQRPEETSRFAVDHEGGFEPGSTGVQNDRLRLPANKVAK